MRRKIILALVALIMAVLPLSAATIHTFNAVYSYHESSHVGLDYTAYPTEKIGLYGGLHAQFTIDGMNPAIIAGGSFGPGFAFALDGYKENVLMQIGLGLDVPVLVSGNRVQIGLGAVADLGIRWRIVEGVQNDGFYLSFGAKAAYTFTYFSLDSLTGSSGSTTSSTQPVPWRVSPYFGIGFCM